MSYGHKYTGSAGMLAVMSGGLGLVVVGWIIIAGRYNTFDLVTGAVVLVAAIGSIWGARRFVFPGENYKMAIIFGGICSLVCGLLFGLIALILIILSKKEFEDLPPELRQR